MAPSRNNAGPLYTEMDKKIFIKHKPPIAPYTMGVHQVPKGLAKTPHKMLSLWVKETHDERF